MYHAVHHIALRVADLRGAEDYYRALFGAAVAFREAKVADGWRTLPPDADWGDAENAGITLQLVMLAREGLRVALFRSDAEIAAAGRLDHINVEVNAPDLAAMRDRAPALGCRVALDAPQAIILDDRYGVRWELTTALDQGSNGETHGRWLDVRKRGDDQ